MWIDALLNAIMTPYNHPIHVHVNEIFIKQKPPDSVHELPTVMGQYGLLLSIPFGMNPL
jgi:hypothetical protein